MTLNEIESNLFESLKKNSCPPLKNVLNIEANKTIKDIICDQVYVEEKLNLFIWLIVNYEPRLASEFEDVEFGGSELKCRKLIDCLNILGLVDLNEFTLDRLLNTNVKYYKDILLILNDLNDLYVNKSMEHTTHTNDIFELDLLACDTYTNGNYLGEILSKRIQMLDDVNLYKEYRSVLQHLSTSVIPSDMQRVIKVINENSMCSISVDKDFKRDDLINLFENEISNVDNKIEEINHNLNKYDLVNIDEDKKESCLEVLNDFRIEMNQAITYVKEFNQFVDSLTNIKSQNETNKKRVSLAGVESNFGKSFYDFQTAYNQYLKFRSCLIDWSNYLKFHSERLAEFKASNLIEPGFYETTNNCNLKLKQCSELLINDDGVNSKKVNNSTKLNMDANSTAVDELLML